MKIVTLCGSTRFQKEFEQCAAAETMKGNLVFTVHIFRHDSRNEKLTEKELWELDQLHFRKILSSDEILVINKNKYVGLGTCDEIGLAWANGISVRFMEDVPSEVKGLKGS